MNYTTPTDLKSILHSKRANLFYLEHCRVLVKDGRVEYVTKHGKDSAYWNIPIANTTNVILGSGTSITQAAMRELSKAGVLVGFCGGNGTPLFNATEAQIDIEWFLPQSEYRPTQYLQLWLSFWPDEQKRLTAAKKFQRLRLQRLEALWTKPRFYSDQGFNLDRVDFEAAITNAGRYIEETLSTVELMTAEGRLAKTLYKLAAKAVGYGDFTRAKRGKGTDAANSFLDHGNYLAYGLAATAAWVLGLPHGLPVLHGKTRRGGLVFDIADMIKDSTILPQAFISAMRGQSASEFRQACTDNLLRTEALDFMLDSVKAVAEELGEAA